MRANLGRSFKIAEKLDAGEDAAEDGM